MAQVNELSTKNASQLLDISTSSVRLYAKTMEAMGYEFKQVDNARRFTQYDIQVISEAMERYKLVGGTMKQALHYTIVKFEQGKEVADAIPEPRKEINNTPEDLKALQSNLLSDIRNNVQDELSKHHNELLKAIESIHNEQDSVEDVNHLKQENERLNSLYEQIKTDKEKLEQENAKLHDQLNKFNSMSMWEFRKWKKIND
ncbi:hypothetical protein ACFYSI_13590 [Staphylococcus xylosus]|uniref:hypothetical protein n=1 Tax=Staphylococcus xylosus TaxID=1288 RepID=UPI0036CFF1F1